MSLIQNKKIAAITTTTTDVAASASQYYETSFVHPPGVLGISIGDQDGSCLVEDIVSDSSLFRMGDIIESMDGKVFHGLSIGQYVEMTKGEYRMFVVKRLQDPDAEMAKSRQSLVENDQMQRVLHKSSSQTEVAERAKENAQKEVDRQIKSDQNQSSLSEARFKMDAVDKNRLSLIQNGQRFELEAPERATGKVQEEAVTKIDFCWNLLKRQSEWRG